MERPSLRINVFYLVSSTSDPKPSQYLWKEIECSGVEYIQIHEYYDCLVLYESLTAIAPVTGT